MGRRKSKRKPEARKKNIEALDTQFTCPFCNHEKACEVGALHSSTASPLDKFSPNLPCFLVNRSDKSNLSLLQQVEPQSSLGCSPLGGEQPSPHPPLQVKIDKSKHAAKIQCTICLEDFQVFSLICQNTDP